MAIAPRFPTLPTSNAVEGLDPYTENSTDVLNNRGRGPLPEAMSGENLQHTAVLPAEAGLKNESYKSATFIERKYQEPSMPVGGTIKSSVWQTRYGGAYIEMSGKAQHEEFINIVHSSGTHITIDSSGSVIIKSFGDQHNVSDGNMHEMVTGAKEAVYGGGYIVHVKNGVCEIRSEGNMNISSGADMTISAAGRLNMNIGDAFDLGASKIALTSRVDTLDIVSNGIMRLNSISELHLKSEGNMFAHTKADYNLKSEASSYILSQSNIDIKASGSITNQADGAYNIRSASSTNIQAGGQINLKASGNINADGANVFLNSGRAGNAPNANPAADAKDGIRAAVEAEPAKSVFSENRTMSSAANIGTASLDDSADV
jgi:hypothetical protein